MDQPLPSQCRVEAWRPPIDGIAEVFHARIVDYGYPPHCHDTWTVLIVDNGAISYALDKRDHGAAGQTVAILPPGVTHDGAPAPGAAGFTKRVLYLDADVLPSNLVGAAVDQTNLDDPDLRTGLASLHHELVHDADPLHAESALALVVDRIIGHLTANPVSSASHEPTIASTLREMLDGAGSQAVSLAEAAVVLNRSKAHLVRTFTATYGVAPHAYLIAKRVETSRRLLLQGAPAAEVATTAGFYDQSHLTRHFKRHTSVTPTQYAKSHAPTKCAGRPSDRAAPLQRL